MKQLPTSVSAMQAARWCPSEGHVHLRIWLADVALDYTATAEAARNIIMDWARRHWCTIELILNTVERCEPMRRLPCERLFLGP
ncbi:hypothetical protein ACWDXV_21770 [Nocardia nova]|uniref:hypothetical protein n=1 Tax=Nocardia nova TaxID=37330 RepID=UPI0011B00BA5|nr:hypothetical protein [Nocardia nova]